MNLKDALFVLVRAAGLAAAFYFLTHLWNFYHFLWLVCHPVLWPDLGIFLFDLNNRVAGRDSHEAYRYSLQGLAAGMGILTSGLFAYYLLFRGEWLLKKISPKEAQA
jgi:hypothetical protein